ncbi:unnamed protein product [Candidula unifasciata]|uniref:Uncharacterized protein n=1 Tax=Candidula unifasciata TaxID=100452 RepID=A0A8S3ZRU0_9EUPU|nr:unnamed protein product [Candidula unifasciata]
MAESTKPHQRSYIPFFLLRRAQRAGKGGRKSKVTRAAELRQTDVVSKSVDSLLAVASSISLPPNATVRTDLRPERHSLQQFSSPSSLSSSPSNTRIRRHSYGYTVNDKSEDSSEFFDCRDGVSDGDFTSSSQEPSPIRYPRATTTNESSDSRGRRQERFVKRQSTLSSLGMSTGFASDRDSADSDIDEKSSHVLDLDTSLLAGSEDDSSSYSESPTITVHTSRAKVGENIILCSISSTFYPARTSQKINT